jgi:hypothetical protein
MVQTTLLALISGVAIFSWGATAHAATPLIDNERITVWDTTTALPPAEHDFIAVSLTHKGHAKFGHQGDIPARDGVHTVVVELKGNAPPPFANTTGLPLAFPRPHVKKLFENDQVVVWRYVWYPGQATPMHFHDKDALVVFDVGGDLSSTTPDGKTIVNHYKDGDIRFNKGNRSHTELLVSGHVRAVITELK